MADEPCLLDKGSIGKIMKRRKILKYILLTTLVAVGIIFTIFAYQVYNYFYWFGLEDRVVHSYEGIIFSIEKYIEENQKPPETLSIVPSEDMEDIQQIKEIVKTSYHVIPERNAWKLDVLVRAKGKERQFVYVSDGELTPEEESRYYIWCHDWDILRIP